MNDGVMAAKPLFQPLLLLQTMLATAFGVLVYVTAAYLLRIGELQEILAFLRGRLRRAPAEIDPA